MKDPMKESESATKGYSITKPLMFMEEPFIPLILHIMAIDKQKDESQKLRDALQDIKKHTKAPFVQDGTYAKWIRYCKEVAETALEEK